ncbi:MAG: glutathione S-transferase family protein [Deltaproteobacteria bacterium]|nr:glutathione S-transferase family protein [Deltaproteobacteria bacterium]MBW2399619.1 glutathione S-transferase family protein [Deltaproteobacteria bacterium]
MTVHRAAERDGAASGGRVRVHGAKISYFTGKLESYLRYREIPYDFVPSRPDQLRKRAGAAQLPAVALPDGRFITDTTPIISWFEQQHPASPVVPEDPLQAFTCRLIEDYADEWLWRPAMHYRWSYDVDKYLLSREIVRELTTGIPVPAVFKRFMIRQRQLRVFVTGDGVNPATRPHVEGSYLCALDLLSSIFERRPFVLGARPTLADIGLMGPMLRHFSHDPTPAAIMQERAPAVWEWVARMWNAKASKLSGGALVPGVPSDLEPLLAEIGETHLEYLSANAIAWQGGDGRFDVTIQGTAYRRVPASRYRVWCLEELRKRFADLPETAASEARGLLQKNRCWEPLWRPADLASGHDPDRRAPFVDGLEVLTARGARARRD